MGSLSARAARARMLLTAGGIAALVGSQLLSGAAVVAASTTRDAPPGSVDIQLLSINDFHGQLPAPGGTISVTSGTSAPPTKINAGGIVYLAQQVRALEAENPNTLFMSAGDLVGASPLVSAFYHDEPTIEAMNDLGMDLAVVGNHEFDEGLAELYRLQDGGCHPIDGCQTGHTYTGADFQYLAANVIGPNGKPIFPAYKIRSFGGAKVGIIGVVTRETPSIVMASSVAGLTFLSEQDTVNKYAEELKAKGVNTIVVLLHAGNSSSASSATTGDLTVNGCPTNMHAGNAFYDLVAGMDSSVRVVLSGHSHNFYNCAVGDKIVTGASSAGRVLTDVDLTIDRSTDEATSVSAHNVLVANTGTPDLQAASLLSYYNALSAPLRNQVIGSITGDITRAVNAAGESALGDVIADAQLAASSSPSTGNAMIAMTNPGGLRADLISANSPGGESPGQITYEEAFAVQPFYNILTTITLTGAQIKAVLEQQVGPEAGSSSVKMLQVSHGLTYTWTGSATTGAKVSNLSLDGLAIAPTASYRVTVNNFLAGGGDSFTALKGGTDPYVGVADIDALVAYFGAHSPVAPGPQNRFTYVP